VHITLAGIAIALVASDSAALVMFLALIGFAVTGSALPGPTRARQAAATEGEQAPADG
jgi:hypothetical protein